jgi:hypothetical protein
MLQSVITRCFLLRVIFKDISLYDRVSKTELGTDFSGLLVINYIHTLRQFQFKNGRLDRNVLFHIG